jgi:DNA-binding CsgD family transcriptional regulator
MQITTATERRKVHAALAATTRDPVRRGRHLAAAATGPDEHLAEDIAEGATRAFERGGIAEAEELAELALRLTPRNDPRRDDRVLELGRYLFQANELARLRKLLEAEAGSLVSGRARAHAHLLQAHVPGSQDEYEAHLHAVLAGDADEDHRLRALVALSLDRTVSFLDRLDEGQAQAERAMALASDPVGVAKARYALAWVRVLRGQSLESVDHAVPSGRALYGYGGELAEVVGVQLAARGDLEAARAVLGGVMDRAAAIGDEENWYAAHQKFCELELRAGRADRADALIQEQVRQDWEIRVGLRATLIRDQAHLAMLRGDHAAARDLVARVHDVIHGQRWDALAADSVLAAAELLAAKPAAALDAGLRTWRHCEREGVDDIGLFPVAPDVVEAALALGEVSVALDVTDRLARLAEAQEHPWGLASASRCRAMLALSSGDDEPARDALLSASARYDELGCRFDAARTLLSLGRHARRHRRWAVARDALQRAADAFRALGCQGWAAEADGLMAGLGGRRPAARDRLTPTERRAAELASEGRSNKEIAAAMFVGVHTVEVHLGRAYAKLGVQSRAQLARALVDREPGAPIN